MAHYKIGDNLYNADPTTWPNVDVASVQRVLGCSAGVFLDRIGTVDVLAIQALIWVLRRRTEPALKIDEVEFTLREFFENTVDTDDDVRENWPTMQGTTKEEAEQRKQYLARLPVDQRERLFDEAGTLRAEEAAAPLDSPPDSDT